LSNCCVYTFTKFLRTRKIFCRLFSTKLSLFIHLKNDAFGIRSFLVLPAKPIKKGVFMGWLQRLFGKQEQDKRQKSQGNQTTRAAQSGGGVAQAPATTSRQPSAQSNAQSIPPERVGLDGQYDESGLAKRVAAAFDDDPSLDDIDTLYVAQTGGTVVLKGKAPNQQILTKMATVAKGVRGATAVDTTQVTIG
jgi:hypothetical protein